MAGAAAHNPSLSLTLAIVDDNPGSLEMLVSALKRPDLTIRTFDDAEEALDFILNEHPPIVLSDIVMPKMTGMELLDRIVEADPSIDVLLMTAHYSTESAVEAIKKGASDYLNKPVSLGALRERIGQLIDQHQRRQRSQRLEENLTETAEFQGMVGNSSQMWALFSQVQRIAPHYRSVLITGQTGTGKELVARALHNLSPVSRGQFVALNCSAVVETLFESELFGHTRGAFTGATQDKIGLFEYAHQGTLFLDEIGDMPLSTQAKLLRALQNQEVQRLGALTPRKVNVHVIAATHRDLRNHVAEGKFREDLFYRLTMVELPIPSLSEREGDLALLTRFFVGKFSAQYGKQVRGLTNRAHLVLTRHRWPGNVRELENVIGHACIMVMGSMIDVPDLPAYLAHGSSHAEEAIAIAPENGMVPLEEQEKRLLGEALRKAGGNQSEAARLLRISRDTLRYRMKKHGIA